jgi:hypothetical protein
MGIRVGIVVSRVAVQKSCRRIVVIEHSIAYCGIITGIVIGVLLYHEIMIDIAVWEECSSIAGCCISRVSEMGDCCIKSVLA